MIRAVGTGDGLRFEVYALGRHIGSAHDWAAAKWIETGYRRDEPPPPLDTVARLRLLGLPITDEAADYIEALRWAVDEQRTIIENLRAEVANAREHQP